MNYKWINKVNNSKLIVFFNGWAMNESAVSHFKNKDFDILMFNNYIDINFNFLDFDFDLYKEKYLICWSMGVYVANKFKNIFDNFDKKIAINGTQIIYDNQFGIPKKIYDITYKLLNPQNLEKFILNMSNNENIKNQIKLTFSIEDLKEELISIKNLEINENIIFDKVIISDDDKIIPTQNQMNYWKDKTFIMKIKSQHYPFFDVDGWNEIIC